MANYYAITDETRKHIKVDTRTNQLLIYEKENDARAELNKQYLQGSTDDLNPDPLIVDITKER